MENTEEDDLWEIPAPKEHPTRDRTSNADQQLPKNVKKLPFTLILKKEDMKTECCDSKPNYAVKVRSKVHSYQKPSGSRSIWDSAGTSANLRSKRKRGDLTGAESKLPNTSALPFNIKTCDFKPVPLIDVDDLRYCSFCFTSNQSVVQANEHACSLEDFPGLPSDYWPIGWPNVQSLSYSGINCAVSGCQAEINDSMELLEHVKTCHRVAEDHVPTLEAQSQQETSYPSEDKFIKCKDGELCKNNSDDISHQNIIDTDGKMNEDDAMNIDKGSDIAIDCSTEESITNELPPLAGPFFDSESIGHTSLYSDDETERNCGGMFDDVPSDMEDGNFNSLKAADLMNEQLELVQPNVESNTFSLDVPLKPYKCGFCHSMTLDVRHVMQHYLHCHDINILFICEECNFVSHQQATLKKHWSRYHFSRDALPEPIVVTEEPFDESVMMKRDYPFKLMSAVTTNSNTESNISIPDHNLENYNEFLRKPFSYFRIRCKLCDYYTKTFLNIRYHIVAKHITAVSETLINMIEDTTSYRCVTCKAVKETKAAMATHYVGKHLKTRKLECDLCEKSLCDINKFNKHCVSDMHADFYRRSLRCKKCLFATLTKAKLQKHAIEHVPDLKCTECDFKTKKKSMLNWHIASIHQYKKNEDGLYLCESEGCIFSTTVKRDFCHHIRVEHQTKKKSKVKYLNASVHDEYKNNESDGLFASSTKAKPQKHAIENDADFKCTKCDYKTKVKTNLSYHIFLSHECKKKEDGLYHCEREGCCFSATVKQDFHHHIRVEHLPSKYRKVPCDKCDFVAASSRSYKLHLKRHKVT